MGQRAGAREAGARRGVGATPESGWRAEFAAHWRAKYGVALEDTARSLWYSGPHIPAMGRLTSAYAALAPHLVEYVESEDNERRVFVETFSSRKGGGLGDAPGRGLVGAKDE